MKFEDTKSLIECFGGCRRVAFELDYDLHHVKRIADGKLSLNEKIAYRFLRNYSELKPEDINHLIK